MSNVSRKPLTHARHAEIAKPEEKPYMLNAGDGLFLEVLPNGSKRWRFRYTYAGKRNLLSMGLYPEVGLQAAREKRDQARKLLAEQEVDPSDHRKTAKKTTLTTFKALAEEWLEHEDHRAPATQTKNRWLLQFAIDAFGNRPIKDVSGPMILELCRGIEKEGKLETAQRVKAKCGQVFNFAYGKGLVAGSPTTHLRGQLKTPKVNHRAAITDPQQVGALLRDIDAYGGQAATKAALKLAALTFVRPGELRSAQWKDIDFKAGVWCYTPPKTRNQTQLEHIVPLSTQAKAILLDLHPLTGSGPYVFRSFGKEGHLSEAAVLSALRRMGYDKDEMSGHGFRAMARTILEERLDFRVEWIEQQLAHKVADMHGRAYNRTKHLPERRRMMQAWADYLDQLREGAEVISLVAGRP